MKKNHTFKMKKTALSSAILWAIGSAHAATIYVTGSCTLVDAMAAANSDTATGSCPAGSGNDTIQVVEAGKSITINTIFETSANGPGDVGLPIVTSNMVIEGNGLTLRANNSTDNFRLLEVSSGADLTLRDTTVTGADDGYGFGSGLLSYDGRVTLDNTTFTKNNGAIMLANSYGNVIKNSTIRHNIGSYYAGGLMTSFAEVDIANSGFIANKLTFGSIIKSNSPMGGGGGGGNPFPGGGASFFQSTVTINNSTFSGNESLYGAGLSISSDALPFLPSNTVHFSNSSMRGVIQNDVTISNSTITANQAFSAPGIVDTADQGTLTLQGNIIAGNKELYTVGFAANIYSAGNTAITLDGNNIIGDNGLPGVYNVTLGASDQTFSNSASDNLYPLTLSNGQFVHPLKVGSVAIDGNDLSCFGSVIDQEGKGRGLDGDDNGSFVCDVGAFEHSLPIIADDAPCDLISAIVSANNDASVNGCQPGNGHDIIALPDNSMQNFDTAIYNDFVSASFALPAITSGISLEGHGSLIRRDATAVDPFDLFLVIEGGQLNLIDAIVTGANGELGAVTSYYGNAKILNSSITANQSVGFLDFISNNSAVIQSTLSSNTPPSGHFGQQFGAGLTTYYSTGFQLSRSTINDNNNGDFVGGADFRQVVQASIENSTISNNSSNAYGGIIIVGNQNRITGITVTGNAGGAAGGMVVAPSFGPIAPNTISHSIISGNSITPVPPVVGDNSQAFNKQALFNPRGVGPTPPELLVFDSSLVLTGYNILGQNGDSGTDGVTLDSSDQIPVGATNTVIETTLADNGGETQTHLPVAGGIAVDGGNFYCGLNEDQRGYIRPWDGDGDSTDTCDVGAVEYGSVASSDLIFKDGFDAEIILRRK